MHFDADNRGTAYGITVSEICEHWPELCDWVWPRPIRRLQRWRQCHRRGLLTGSMAVAAAVFVAVGWWVNDLVTEPPPTPSASPSPVPAESAPTVLRLGARTPRGEPDWPSEVWARPGERIEFNAFYSGTRASATAQARLTVKMSEGLRHVPGSTIRYPDDSPEGEPLYDSPLFERWAAPDPLFPRTLDDDSEERGTVRFVLQVVAEQFCVPRERAVTLQVHAPPREAATIIHVACDPRAKSPDVLLETAVRNASIGDPEWLGRVRPKVGQEVECQVFFMNRTDEVARDARVRLTFPNPSGVEFRQPVSAELTWGGGERKSAVPAAIVLLNSRSTVERSGRMELRKGEQRLERFGPDVDAVPLGDLEPGEAGYVKLRVTVLDGP